MTKKCPNCSKSSPDDAKFCVNCGYSFLNKNSNILENGKIFLIIIAIVVILGLIVIATTGDSNTSQVSVVDVDHVDLTIINVGGYDNGDKNKTAYTLYTEVLFTSVPDDLNDYNIKTTYYDSSNKEIGHDISSLKSEYTDSEYGTYIGHYTSYKLPKANSVSVEIIKNGKVIDNFTDNVDMNKIDFLN